jgi:hypothetical protein
MATATARTSKSSNKHHLQNGNGRKAYDHTVETLDEMAATASQATASIAHTAQRRLIEGADHLREFWPVARGFAPTAFAKSFGEANIEVFELFSRQAGALADWPARIAKIRSAEQLFRAQTDLMQELVFDFQETSQRVWSHWAKAFSAATQRTSQMARRARAGQRDTVRRISGRHTEGVSAGRAAR